MGQLKMVSCTGQGCAPLPGAVVSGVACARPDDPAAGVKKREVLERSKNAQTARTFFGGEAFRDHVDVVDAWSTIGALMQDDNANDLQTASSAIVQLALYSNR